MSRDENLERLRAASAGRIAVSMQALPYVFLAPIRLVDVEGGIPTLVVALDHATAGADALEHVVVAVHTDGVDHDGEHWEVLVRGLSTCADQDGTGGMVKHARVRTDLLQGWRTRLDPMSLDR